MGENVSKPKLDTSYVLWQYVMLYPEARDICDIASKLFVSEKSP